MSTEPSTQATPLPVPSATAPASDGPSPVASASLEVCTTDTAKASATAKKVSCYVERQQAQGRITPTLSSVLQGIVGEEGAISHLYCDTAGNVTTGVGQLLKSENDAAALPMTKGDKVPTPATIDEKKSAFRAVQAACKEDLATASKTAKEGKGRINKKAQAYAKVKGNAVRLPEEAQATLLTSRVEKEFIPQLQEQFPLFSLYPQEAQAALIDMVYNLGAGGLGKYVKLKAAVLAQDWGKAAGECSRKGISKERNERTMELFQKASEGRTVPVPLRPPATGGPRRDIRTA